MITNIINLLAEQNLTGGTSIATSSYTPPPASLILLSVISRTGITAAPNQPTATGNGLTWVAIASVNYDIQGSSRKRLTLFRAFGQAPTTGATTIDFAGQTQTEFSWIIDYVAGGVNQTGANGAGAIMQSATNLSDQGGGGAFTVTLGTFSSSNNATYGVLTNDVGTVGTTPGTGFTQIALISTAECLITEWQNSNATAVSANMPSGSLANSGGIAIEIAVSHNLNSNQNLSGNALRPRAFAPGLAR